MRHDLLTLQLVLAIADTRSTTRGAMREGIALAAASKRLSDLETRLGVTLFERRARGVEPTEAGRALVRHLRSLASALHAMESDVGEFTRGIKGHLRIASNAGAIAEYLLAVRTQAVLPAAVQRFVDALQSPLSSGPPGAAAALHLHEG